MLSMTHEEYNAYLARRNLAKSTKNPVPLEEKPSYPKKKAPKYGNIHIYVYEDGFTCSEKDVSGHGEMIHHFDSKKEHARWAELVLLERSGKISDLKTQAPLTIQEKVITKSGEKLSPIVYKADFLYVENGLTIVEDVKGIDKKTGKVKSTEAFKLKWKLLKAKYPDYLFKIV